MIVALCKLPRAVDNSCKVITLVLQTAAVGGGTGLKILHKGLFIVLLPFSLNLIFAGCLAFFYLSSEKARAEYEQSRQVMENVGAILSLYARAGESVFNQTMVVDVTGEDQFANFETEIPARWRELEAVCINRPKQLAAIHQSKPRAKLALEAIMEARSRLAKPGGLLSLLRRPEDQEKTAVLISEVSDDLMSIFMEEKRRRIYLPKQESERQFYMLMAFGTGVVLNIVLAALLLVYFGKEVTSRLAVLIANITSMAAGKPLLPKMRGSDEIACVDADFHTMADALERAESKRKDLIAIVNHDIRTPLTCIGFFFEAMGCGVYGEVPDTLRHIMVVPEQELSRLKQLLEELLAAEQRSRGEISLLLDTTNLQNVFSKAVHATRHLTQEKAVRIKSMADEPILVYADEDRLVQALVNLLANAIKGSPEGGDVVLNATRHGDTEVQVEIYLQGGSIETMAFEKSMQFSNQNGLKGSEFGFYICKIIIERHGGTTGVRREPDRDIFWFKLPIPAMTLSEVRIDGG